MRKRERGLAFREPRAADGRGVVSVVGVGGMRDVQRLDADMEGCTQHND